MRKNLLALFILLFSNYIYSQNENPFQQFGYDVLVASSSKGEFNEFHDQTDIVEIGSVLFNTKTHEIVKILDKDETTIDISSATAAMSIDPLCEKYYWISPYAYVANNPLKFVDPDGRKIKIANNAAGAIENIAKIAITSFGGQVLDHLISQQETYTLNSTFWSSSSQYDYKNREINYVGAPWLSNVPSDGGSLSSLTAMGHETFHAFDHSNNTGGAFANDNKVSASRGMLEGRAVSFGNYLRAAYNLTPYREKYGNFKENFFQFTNNPSESITNFTGLGGNKEGTSKGFSYTKTVTQTSVGLFGLPTGEKKVLSQSNYYIIVSTDKNKNTSYKIYTNEQEYKDATKGW